MTRYPVASPDLSSAKPGAAAPDVAFRIVRAA
jgi:hypothetical protein